MLVEPNSMLNWKWLLIHTATFQDCKEFQAELFGICNLFRDLSDKLFTSEIIELHENKRKEEDGTNSKQDLNVLGMYFVPEKEITAASLEAAESSKHKEEEYTAVAPVLEDFGIVYAHRYEDIVNLGPAKIKEKKEQTAFRLPASSAKVIDC
ncbi:hypothetical protein K7X08_020770 [Anisodus acutangulus]|uniref:Uncharacterized protein n=1 Tax=Anisodus acutangulus TaxID=402998 RepID=A0A9Q1RMR5_9SOLA|nr:hypothetical protein K7X08_020770 [Anisodus acutangulus]